jgi:hypothetical protein
MDINEHERLYSITPRHKLKSMNKVLLLLFNATFNNVWGIT